MDTASISLIVSSPVPAKVVNDKNPSSCRHVGFQPVCVAPRHFPDYLNDLKLRSELPGGVLSIMGSSVGFQSFWRREVAMLSVSLDVRAGSSVICVLDGHDHGADLSRRDGTGGRRTAVCGPTKRGDARNSSGRTPGPEGWYSAEKRMATWPDPPMRPAQVFAPAEATACCANAPRHGTIGRRPAVAGAAASETSRLRVELRPCQLA